MKPVLTIDQLKIEANQFSEIESTHKEPTLYGVTDGKAVGTYLEHKFHKYLDEEYIYAEGSSAKGIDFPELMIDMKVTSIRQPQSSCPFKSAWQKVYGLGYNLIIFVYEKIDDETDHTGRLNILHTIFVENEQTGDFQTTTGISRILENDGNKDDLTGFFTEINLPLDEIGLDQLAEEILNKPPKIGYLTISNALQWRLQYSRVIEKAGTVEGIVRVK